MSSRLSTGVLFSLKTVIGIKNFKNKLGNKLKRIFYSNIQHLMNEFAGSLQILVRISWNYKKLIFCFSRSLAMRAIIIFGYTIGLFDSILNFSR